MRAIPLAYNARNLLVRWIPTSLTVACIGLVIGVFVAAMALAKGLEETLRSAGRTDNWIVMRAGADAEMHSVVNRDAALEIVGHADANKAGVDVERKGLIPGSAGGHIHGPRHRRRTGPSHLQPNVAGERFTGHRIDSNSIGSGRQREPRIEEHVHGLG